MSEIMETLQWKPLKERRRENRLILFYKGLNGQTKIPTTDVLQNNRKNRNRHNQQFYIPCARTDTLKYSFIPTTVRDWNTLDPTILEKSANSETLTTFWDLIRSFRLDYITQTLDTCSVQKCLWCSTYNDEDEDATINFQGNVLYSYNSKYYSIQINV